MQVPSDGVLDEEYFAVVKEHALAAKCEVPAAEGGSSFFWTVMSQNGNAPRYLGSDQACLPQCYHEADGMRGAGWPPAVNASSKLCPANCTAAPIRQSFDMQPMNQGKVMTGFTDPRPAVSPVGAMPEPPVLPQ